MGVIRRHELNPSKPLAPKAERWSELPKELREQLLLEAVKGMRQGNRA